MSRIPEFPRRGKASRRDYRYWRKSLATKTDVYRRRYGSALDLIPPDERHTCRASLLELAAKLDLDANWVWERLRRNRWYDRGEVMAFHGDWSKAVRGVQLRAEEDRRLFEELRDTPGYQAHRKVIEADMVARIAARIVADPGCSPAMKAAATDMAGDVKRQAAALFKVAKRPKADNFDDLTAAACCIAPHLAADRAQATEDDQRAAAVAEECRKQQQAEREHLHSLQRGDKCGIGDLLYNQKTGAGSGVVFRCRRWTGCEYCRHLNERREKELIRVVLKPLSHVYLWRGFTDDATAAARQIRGMGGEYRRYLQPGGRCLIVYHVREDNADRLKQQQRLSRLLSSSERATPEAAQREMGRAIENIPRGTVDAQRYRPVDGSRAWSREQQLPKSGCVRLQINTDDLETAAEILRDCGAEVTFPASLIGHDAAAASASMLYRFRFKLPARHRTKRCIEHLKGWIALGQPPPGGDLRIPPPEVEFARPGRKRDRETLSMALEEATQTNFSEFDLGSFSGFDSGGG